MGFSNMSASKNQAPSSSWNSNNNIDGIEFMFKSPKTIHDQTLLCVSASSNRLKKHWDLRLVSSGSHPRRSKLEFRLSGATLTGSTVLTTNAISMSTDYASFKGTGWWNVLLQRMTGSHVLTQSYQLLVAKNDEDSIPDFYTANSLGGQSGSLILSPTTRVSHSYFNHNFTSSGNIQFGDRNYSGSLAEIRTWSGSLSASKFKQHVLNPLNHTGNGIQDSYNKIIYRFRLGENTPSGSSNIVIKDSNPSFNTDFSYTSSLINYGDLYNTELMKVYRLSTRTDGVNQKNDNQVIFENFRTSVRGNLDSTKYVTTNKNDGLNKRKTSTTIDLRTSPSDVLNDIIINKLSDKSIADSIGKVSDGILSNENYYPD